MEREVAACVQRLLPNEVVRFNVKGLLPNNQEIDIVVPSLHMAFEFNGMRLHSEELGKPQRYHYDKVIECRKVGYRLIHIWEDDWVSRRNVVVRMIAAKLGVTSYVHDVFPEIDERCSDRLFARKLSFCDVSGKVAG
jgi:hypothetical protein